MSKKYLETADADWYNQRLIRVIFCVVAAFLILFVRLFYLQIIQGGKLRKLSENNRIRLQCTDPPRGLIYDRNGLMLVDNRPSFDLSIVLKDAKPVARTIENLAKLIKVPVSDFMGLIDGCKGVASYKPILLKQDIGRDTLAVVEVKKYDLPGVTVSVTPRRQYIYQLSAAHLLGYLSEINSVELKSQRFAGCKAGDFIGKFGAEKAFESFLRGTRGGRQVEVSVTGQIVDILKTVDAKPGYNIYLTIDQILQMKAEALLEGSPGAVVAMEPDTGHIIVLASYPPFDQNAFVNGMSHEQWESLISNPYRPLENKAIQGEYPPASTYKIVTAFAGLEERIIDEKTTFYCPGYFKFGDRVYRCWRKEGHGSVNVIQALAESCDVFFYQVGQELDIDQLAWYAKACGLGSATEINLDQESTGLVPTASWKKRRTGIDWQQGETLLVAIGQSFNLVTPIQMLVLTSALANGGIRYQPLILSSIKTAESEEIIQSKPRVIGKLPGTGKSLEIIRKGLWEVVNNPRGTGWGARVKGIDISGKTGTAQVFSRQTDDPEPETEVEISDHLKAHAWFVAYAPSRKPKIAVAVIIEHGEHGASAAAPIAREIIRAYLNKEHPDGQLNTKQL